MGLSSAVEGGFRALQHGDQLSFRRDADAILEACGITSTSRSKWPPTLGQRPWTDRLGDSPVHSALAPVHQGLGASVAGHPWPLPVPADPSGLTQRSVQNRPSNRNAGPGVMGLASYPAQ
jgi:hypothetical protein